LLGGYEMNRGIIPLIGMGLLPFLLLLLGVSAFSWFALHTLVPLLLLVGLIGVGGYIIYKGFQSKLTFKIGKTTIPMFLITILIGSIFLMTALFMYKPTAGYTLAVAQPFAVFSIGEDAMPTEEVQEGLGVFDSDQLFSIVNTETESTAWQMGEHFPLILLGLVGFLIYLERKKKIK